MAVPILFPAFFAVANQLICGCPDLLAVLLGKASISRIACLLRLLLQGPVEIIKPRRRDQEDIFRLAAAGFRPGLQPLRRNRFSQENKYQLGTDGLPYRRKPPFAECISHLAARQPRRFGLSRLQLIWNTLRIQLELNPGAAGLPRPRH